MQSPNYHDATVLLFDRKGAVLRQTMSVLTALGFKHILDFQDLAMARQALDNHRADLVILAIESADSGKLDDGGVLKLVDDIRKRRCGIDPFMPILLTTWDASLRSVRAVVDSGSDDMLLHPFSISQMGQRIEVLAKARKPFVVTEDYFGPDRRSSADLKADPSSIVVPNALQARISENKDAAPNAARIEEAFAGLQRLKLRNIARRIWYLANRLKESLGDPSLPLRYEDELTLIRNSVRKYHKTLVQGDDPDLPRLCEDVAKALARLFGMPPDEDGIGLLERNALALRVASKLEFEQGDSAEVIRGEESARLDSTDDGLIQAVMG